MTKSSPPPSSVNRLQNGNIEIELVIGWPDIQKACEHAVKEAIAQTEITGFRKGKAPRDLVEPKLDKSQLYSHAIQHLLPEAYARVIKAAALKPILHPKIVLKSGSGGQDWVFTAVTCEAPAVALPDKLSKLDKLQKQVRVNIPDLLIEEEANHRLSALVENLTRLGVTTDTYLQSKKLTPESLKSQIAQNSRTDLEVEFILAQVQIDHKLADRKAVLDFLEKLE